MVKPTAQRGALASAKRKKGLFPTVAGAIVAAGVAYVGYDMNKREMGPAAYAAYLRKELTASFQDAADPTPDFMRNCLPPAHLLERQGFSGTVLLDLEGTVLARKWDRRHGYRFSKRPFLDEFLMTLSQMGFEIVLFSDSPAGVGTETAEKLIHHFPPGSISCNGLLAREHMLFRKGRFVKDLSILPRNPKRVVLVDDDPHSFKRNPNNTILVSEYKDYDASDDELRKVLALLVAMQNSRKDYPDFLRAYSKPKGSTKAEQKAAAKAAAAKAAREAAEAEAERVAAEEEAAAIAAGGGTDKRSEEEKAASVLKALAAGRAAEASSSDSTSAVPSGGGAGGAAAPKPPAVVEEEDDDEDDDVVPTDSKAVIENFTADAERKAAEAEDKRQSGLGGVLRAIKGKSANLSRGKVISANAITMDEIMTTRATNPDPSAAKSVFAKKLARMHARQAAWEAQQRAAQDEANAAAGIPPAPK